MCEGSDWEPRIRDINLAFNLRLSLGLVLFSLTQLEVHAAGHDHAMLVRDALPPSLLADCPGYDGPLVNNGDLAQAYLGDKQALAACNADKEALREWDAKRMAKPEPSQK